MSQEPRISGEIPHKPVHHQEGLTSWQKVALAVGAIFFVSVGTTGALFLTHQIPGLGTIPSYAIIAAGAAGLIVMAFLTLYLKTRHQKPTAPTEEKPEVNPEIPLFSPSFATIQSGKLINIDPKYSKKDKSREAFMGDMDYATERPLISHSPFIRPNMVEHLMRNKRDTAIGTKYLSNTWISNMEGAMHTFVTPICKVRMVGDHFYSKSGHNAAYFENGMAREVVMSAAIQPDFENMQVMVELLSVDKNKEIQGQELHEGAQIPDISSKNSKELRQPFEDAYKKHLIYHLTASKKLTTEAQRWGDLPAAINYIEHLIAYESGEKLKDYYLNHDGKHLSLEMLYNIYVEQLRNEFSALEKLLPQGYVYTISPPAIFAEFFGKDATLMNRLQILALKAVAKDTPLKNLKVIAFNDYADKGAIDLLKKAISTQVVPKAMLFDLASHFYAPPKELENCALVIHNNSDAFGQNIQTEGMTSMDGVVGSCSDAACALRRSRLDLIDHLYSPGR